MLITQAGLSGESSEFHKTVMSQSHLPGKISKSLLKAIHECFVEFLLRENLFISVHFSALSQSISFVQ